MKRTFHDTYVIKEIIQRKSLTDYFWPVEQRTYKRKKLRDLNKREGWICNFLNKGLTLELKILISKNDYLDWPEDHRIPNLNVISSELLFYPELTISLENPVICFEHAVANAEDIRKKIYISNHFGARADNIWAAQLVDPDNRLKMKFSMGFNRDVSTNDLETIDILKKIIDSFNYTEGVS